MQRGRSTAVADEAPEPVESLGTDVIAHRGFADVHPENTITALERAATASDAPAATTVELDVMPCATGEPVVFHDETLDRLTNPPASLEGAAVWETPLEALRTLDVLDSGEPIPLLAEALTAIPDSVRVNVELKHPGVDPGPAGLLSRDAASRERTRWRPFVDQVLDVAAGHDHDLLLSSFFEGALAATRATDPDVPVANVFYDGIEDGFTVADRYDCEAVHPPWNMIHGTPLFNESYLTGPFDPLDLVGRAHDQGRAVNVWTVETATQVRHLEAAGVDGLVVDDPAILAGDAG